MVKTEKRVPFLTDKDFFFNWEILVRKFVVSYSENSWKHVMNSLPDLTARGQEHTIETQLIQDEGESRYKITSIIGLAEDIGK